MINTDGWSTPEFETVDDAMTEIRLLRADNKQLEIGLELMTTAYNVLSLTR